MQQFSNNAQTTLAAALTDVATELTVDDSTAFATLAAGEWEMVTLVSGPALEIVRVTARTGDVWTVARGQEGTTAQAWDSGTIVEARLTAGAMSGLAEGVGLMAYNAAGGDPIGTGAVSMQPQRMTADQVASGDYAVAIGANAIATHAAATAIGKDTYATEAQATALGASTFASGANSCAVGNQCQATAAQSVSIGSLAMAHGEAGIAAGDGATVDADAANSIAIGTDAIAEGASTVAIGYAAATSGDRSVAIGEYAYADAINATALGGLAWAEDDYTAHCSSLYRHVATRLYEIADPEERQAQTAFFSAPVVTVMSDLVDLSDTGTLDMVLPPNTRLFVDTIGLIVVSATTPSGTPQISVLSLSSENVTVTAPYARQIWKDIDSAGVSGIITVTVNTGLTSGAMSARVYLSGIALQE